MLKLLFLLAVCFGIYYLWLRIQKLTKQVRPPTTDDVESMVKCNYCNVYIPQKNAIKGPDVHWYCSIEHQQQMRK